MSRIESHIFLHHALIRLHEQFGVVALPIHDCLAVEADQADVAQLVVELAGEEVLGFRPVIKISGVGSGVCPAAVV